MKQDIGPFDLIVRRTLAALWAEAYVMVHGTSDCYTTPCPHSIDMGDLLEALSRVSPEQQEVFAPSPLSN